MSDLGAALAAIPGLPYQILTDPQGVAWAVLYSPFQLGEDVLLGTLCGDPERLGHVTAAYAMFVFGGVKASMEKPVPGVRPPHGEAPRPHLDEPPMPGERPRLSIDALCSFSGDTVVATADGDQPIANLAVGDLVYGFDERTGTTGLFTDGDQGIDAENKEERSKNKDTYFHVIPAFAGMTCVAGTGFFKTPK